jgi:hypothetical protein
MRAGKAVLLVEGRDDLYVCQEVFSANSVPPCCEVKEHSGSDDLLSAFPLYVENASYSRVGIVVDADENISARWDGIRNILTGLGYQVPRVVDPGGTLVLAPGEDGPPAGVWIMPDNWVSGILENFIRFLVPDEDLLLAHAETCVDGIATETRRFPEVRRPKALIHTWLAWQEEPGSPLGLAIKKQYLDARREHGGRLAAWCRRLFLDEPDPAGG